MKDEKEIQELYRDGTKVKHIAEAYGLSREGVYQRLRKMPDFEQVKQRLYTKAKAKRRKNTLEEHAELLPKIYSMREKGVGSLRISHKLGVPYKTVVELLKGTEYDNTLEAKRIRNQEICKKYKEGMTQIELAKKYNTTQPNISNIIHRHCEELQRGR